MTAASTQDRRPGFLARLFGASSGDAGDPLYEGIIAEARRPSWYLERGVPDTIDGRFDVLTLVLSLVLLRLESGDTTAQHASMRLTERFIDDMDGQMRQIGFGDLVVGKQVTSLMGLLGGRLGAYREGLSEDALVRNLWRGVPPPEPILTKAVTAIGDLRSAIEAMPQSALLAGRLA